MTSEHEAHAWIAGLFNEPLENISNDTLLENIKEWDSMGILLLMADLDEKYSIQADEKIIRELSCVGDIVALLQSH